MKQYEEALAQVMDLCSVGSVEELEKFGTSNLFLCNLPSVSFELYESLHYAIRKLFVYLLLQKKLPDEFLEKRGYAEVDPENDEMVQNIDDQYIDEDAAMKAIDELVDIDLKYNVPDTIDRV